VKSRSNVWRIQTE